jgi:hypothetical protein
MHVQKDENPALLRWEPSRRVPLMRMLFLLACLFLVGCAMSSEKVRCPKTVILAEFSKSIDHHAGAPVRTDLDSLVPECTRDENTIYVDFRLRMTSLRPLTHFNTPMTIKPSYFVAVVDGKGNVVSRSDHDIEITFDEKQTTKVSFIRLQETIPSGQDAAIYVGFNLDEAQFERLKKERETGGRRL